MKVLSREEFLKMPEGTIFCKGKGWYFDNLCIKAQTLQNSVEDIGDFVYLDMNWSNGKDSNEAVDIMEDSLKEGKSFICNDAFGRDGCFDKEDLFLVYEKEDLEKLKWFVQDALRILK